MVTLPGVGHYEVYVPPAFDDVMKETALGSKNSCGALELSSSRPKRQYQCIKRCRRRRRVKAAVLHEVGQALVIEDVSIDKLGPREVLVRTA